MEAPAARRPRLRYAPARRPLLEQALPRAVPKRVADVLIEKAVGLERDSDRKLRGVGS
jgi:hypothetical protein